MQVLVRLVKAVGIVLALLTATAAFALLMAWMKGLLALLMIFFGLVWLVYNALARRDWHKNWRQRNENWRNYK